MSRAYRIRVKETVSKVIRAEDHVSSQLEMLDILPCDQMADLLAEELVRLGFKRNGDKVVRTQGNIEVQVELETGTVTVRSEKSKDVSVSGERIGRGYDAEGTNVKGDLMKSLRSDLAGEISDREKSLQNQLTDNLEAALADLRRELDQAVNRVTAQALKQKASQIGQIKELTEDPESGSMTIVVEV